jgi:hypothetical protein
MADQTRDAAYRYDATGKCPDCGGVGGCHALSCVGVPKPSAARSWDDATPMERLEAEVASLREGLQHLKDCTMWALEQTATREGSVVRPEVVLDEEWSK